MSSAESSKNELSRRSVLAYAAAVASATVLSACDFNPVEPEVPRGPGVRLDGYNAFMFTHAATVKIVISRHAVDPDLFNIEVRQDGETVEFHEGHNDKTVANIESEYFRADYTFVPG
jgi:hypothetical protein